MRAHLVLSLPIVLLAACVSPPVPPTDPQQAQGFAIARDHCAACHAIGATDRGKHPEAIALRDISKSYPVSALEESFAEGIMVGHPDMPEYQMGPDAVRSLIAYLESIQAK